MGFTLGVLLVVAGCGGKQTAGQSTSAAASGSATPVLEPVAPPPPPTAPSDLAPPPSGAGQVPPAVVADPLGKFRERDTTTGQALGDLETLQKIVDGYAFGPNGLGDVPPLKDLSDLVKKGYLKQLPAPPPGKKWAYDPQSWKVSLANQ